MVGEDNCLATSLDSSLGILNSHDTLGDQRKGGEVGKNGILLPSNETVRSITKHQLSVNARLNDERVNIRGTNTITCSTMSVSIGGRIDSVDDCFGTSGLCPLEDDLGCSDVLIEIYLLEGDLSAIGGLERGDLLNAEGSIESWHVKDVCLGGCLHQTTLSFWVSITGPSTGADEEWSREVVSKNGSSIGASVIVCAAVSARWLLRQCGFNVCDVDKGFGSKTISLVDFKVIAV